MILPDELISDVNFGMNGLAITDKGYAFVSSILLYGNQYMHIYAFELTLGVHKNAILNGCSNVLLKIFLFLTSNINN